MNLPLPTVEELAAFSLAAQRPPPWASDAERLVTLTEEHAFDRQLATDLGIAAHRAEHFALGIPPEG